MVNSHDLPIVSISQVTSTNNLITSTRDANISPRQQRNNKKKHGRKNIWDGKITEEFVPRHLSMRLAKQNHMTMSTTLTRSNKSKKN
ncbi:hypothetical protein H5410_006533 [Solanum commersonii]|uniref:Uncharacterized protein n=1 Tax=Solanum commersonii TaxID=4109 RepID=A0A9J6AAJ4_SOLCO|nr:hypothetical protein H5410_006533 [Solanum commersonii]